MSRLASALSIDTDFVNRKDTKLKDVYSGKASLLANATSCNLLETPFSAMTADDITNFINAQCSGDLSFDAKVLKSDTLCWILERRMNDIEGDVANQNETCEIADSSFDVLTSVCNLIVNAIEDYDAAKGGNLPSGVTDQIEAKITLLENQNLNSDVQSFESFFSNPTTTSWITCFNTPRTGMDIWYKYTLQFAIDNAPIIEAIGIGGQDQRKAYKSAIGNLITELNKVIKKNNAYFWKNQVKDTLELGQPITELIKNSWTHTKNSQIRELSRAADCAGTIPTLKEGSMSYLGGGHYIDSENKVKPLAEET